jgi:predicted TIM-barrel fold metal-dependent hydrolase
MMRRNSKKSMRGFIIALIAAASIVGMRGLTARANDASPVLTPVSTSSEELKDFAALQPIDTHVHAFKSDPEFSNFMDLLQLHVLDIMVMDTQRIFRDLPVELPAGKNFVSSNEGHARLCVTFNPFIFQQKDFAKNTTEELRKEFADGAVAVKIWKNIGMEVKSTDGRYVMPDDPAFSAIYKAIAAENKTLIAHVAEPSSCWQPPNPESPDYDYYKENPEWYMYLHPDHPRKEVILASRDHLLEQNPKLRVVGAHLGSMETDVNEIAKRFDRYPNFAVDTAARMEYLMIQPREKVRTFLIKYQDRVLYGTDLEFLNDASTADTLKEWQETYARDWKFLATGETLQLRGRSVQGLALPAPVLQRIFHDNAVHWIPGILSSRPVYK